MKKTLFTIITIFIIALTTANSQSYYKYAIGIRGGFPHGVTGKIFINDAAAFEGIAHYYHGRGLGATFLYEHHMNLLQIPGVNAYLGGGLSVTQYNGLIHNVSPYTGVTIMAVAGVEYTFEDFPLNLSFDFMPGLFVKRNHNDEPFLPTAGLSARYYFN